MPPNAVPVTSAVRAPKSAARSVAATPAGPPPTTSTSIILMASTTEENSQHLRPRTDNCLHSFAVAGTILRSLVHRGGKALATRGAAAAGAAVFPQVRLKF